MTRGRPPVKGIEWALPVARARGRVIGLQQDGETPAELAIVADGRITFIRIRRAEPFRRSPEDLEAENRDALAQLRSIACSAQVSREFWAYSKSGTLRFFRAEDAGLLEIGRDGSPVSPLRASPPAGDPHSPPMILSYPKGQSGPFTGSD